ncbi:MAG: hypothetical protein R2715_05545 [Ilumatobacteraceae bacterium]
MTKPIVAVKAGRGSLHRSRDSYTAALAGPQIAADFVLRQSGITRVDNLEQMFDVAQAFAHQPLPRGRRLAIVGNATGPGVLAADTATSLGLELAELSPATRDAMSEGLPDLERIGNPVDIGPRATGEHMESAPVNRKLADDGVDGVLAVYVSPTPAATPR